jgi:hypothetical protein
MKRVIAGILVLGLVAMVVAVPQPAEARGRFWGGFAVGALTGAVVGGIFAPRVVYPAPPVAYPAYPYYPPAYAAPAPVVVAPAPVYEPAPACYSRWVEPYWNGYGWTPGYWQQVCR